MKKEKLISIFEEKIKNYKERIELLEIRVQDNPNYSLLCKMLSDSLALSEDVYVDIYMYELAMDNYNNPELFLGNYYCDYATVKINMIWERVIFFLAHIHGVKFDKISRNNSWDTIYNNLKEKSTFVDPIRKLFKDLIGDASFGKIKIDRNTNEHDVSVHLTDKLKKVKFDDKFQYTMGEEGFPVLDENVYIDFVNLTNKLVRENKKETIEKLSKALNFYEKILLECINYFENEIINKPSNVIIENMNHYLFSYKNEIDKYCNEMVNKKENLVVRSGQIQEELFQIRERVKNIADTINMNPVLIYEKPPTIQILEYNIDIAYRTVELARSLVIELGIINQQACKSIDVGLTDYMYYHNYTLIRLFSIFEKIAKLLYVRFELNDYEGNKKDLKNKTMQEIVEYAKKENLDNIKPMKMFADTISSKEYELYEEIRNKTYHCIRFEYLLDDKESGEFYIFTLKIMLDLLDKVTEVLEVIEDGEEEFLEVAKIIKVLRH